jgi:hypothetical protein
MRPRLGGAAAAVAVPCCEIEKNFVNTGDYPGVRSVRRVAKSQSQNFVFLGKKKFKKNPDDSILFLYLLFAAEGRCGLVSAVLRLLWPDRAARERKILSKR